MTIEHGRLTFPPCPKCGERAVWSHLMGWMQEVGHNHDPNRKECPNGHRFKVTCPARGCQETKK